MASKENSESKIAWLPDLLYVESRFERGRALVCEASGEINSVIGVAELRDEKRIRLANRALLPGMVNAHSHAFQRVLRGRTEYRSSTHDSFWTWREMMYSAATRLTPEDVYDASRMAFLEMALAGITAVGEFHYLHHAPDGRPYDDPNLLAKEVIRAANDVGLRIALLRVAYARAGFQTEPNPKQTRFIEADAETYLKNLERLIGDVSGIGSPSVSEGSSREDALAHRRASDTAWVGVAPHSVRAVPLDYLRAVISFAGKHNLNVHMHVAEQPAEVAACVEEYGRSPIALLDSEGLLSERFTAVHAIHVTPKAIPSFARTGATVCACPTTERNLGDGVVPADEYLKHNVPICLGTDSHTQIDLWEDARELEYHLRLQKLERAVLDGSSSASEGVIATATQLFDCATVNGARSLGAPGGTLETGRPADFFTVALDDPSIAGASPDDLLAGLVFSASRAAVREVVVGGKPIVSEGQHLIQEEIVERFSELQKRLWG
ncbi:MAG: formimidoylglutamate deiminase [Acidobacteriota bacterium]